LAKAEAEIAAEKTYEAAFYDQMADYLAEKYPHREQHKVEIKDVIDFIVWKKEREGMGPEKID
jgi:hypothetical protein